MFLMCARTLVVTVSFTGSELLIQTIAMTEILSAMMVAIATARKKLSNGTVLEEIDLIQLSARTNAVTDGEDLQMSIEQHQEQLTMFSWNATTETQSMEMHALIHASGNQIKSLENGHALRPTTSQMIAGIHAKMDIMFTSLQIQ